MDIAAPVEVEALEWRKQRERSIHQLHWATGVHGWTCLAPRIRGVDIYRSVFPKPEMLT